LLHSIERPQLLREDGSLLVFERPDSRAALDALQQRMRQQQVPVDFWSGDTIRQAAPQLSNNIQGGLFFPATGHFLDPYH
ncbi:FAD-dependent oxidoreductase, partial [Klebsiella pneumoniae]